MAHQCAACKCELDDEQGTSAEDTSATLVLPTGWYTRCIDETDFKLCDVCGHQSHFCGGISPYLMDRLDLLEGAACDLSAEAAALGVERRSLRKRSQ